MELILIAILILISIACFWEGKTERKGLKIILSIALALMISLIMEATVYSIVASGKLEGLPLIIAYYALPIISFSAFQLLLYDIKVLDK